MPTQANKDNYKKYKNMNLSNQRKAEINYYKEKFDLHKTNLNPLTTADFTCFFIDLKYR